MRSLKLFYIFLSIANTLETFSEELVIYKFPDSEFSMFEFNYAFQKTDSELADINQDWDVFPKAFE